MKSVILTDFLPREKWAFQLGVEEATGVQWEVISLQSNQNHKGKFQNLIRYCKYFILPFKVFCRRREYSRVIAWQQFFGLILAFYLRLFHSTFSPEITVMTFIYNPKKGLIGRLYYAFVRYAVASEYVKHVVVFSEQERAHYAKIFGVDESKFIFVRLSEEDAREDCLELINHGDFCVSAGRSNRDYGFLKNAWVDQTRELRIICDSLDEQSKGNVKILNDCYDSDYIKELAQSHIVIVPLLNKDISSGQLVLLHAMMLGKPVIVTKNTAIAEYVVDGVTGFVIDKTKEDLEAAIKKLDDSAIYQEISKSARRYYEQNFSMKVFGATVGEIVQKAGCV